MTKGPDGDPLLDRWLRSLKDNRVLAAILLFGLVIGALASFTDSLKSLSSLFKAHPAETPGSGSSTQNAPVIALFQTRPEAIRVGEEATIEWRVKSADTVKIDGGIGTVPLNGSRQVAPTSTTKYTLSASNNAATTTSAATLQVSATYAELGVLALNDVFAGDAGWKRPPDPAFTSAIGGGRFRMEWVENRSGACVTRDLAIGRDEDFSIQTTARALAGTEYWLGLCWEVVGGAATYMLHVSPGLSSPGTYMFYRNETWQQTGPDGQPHPYGRSVNVLNPADVNQKFQSAAIAPGTAANVIAVARRGDRIQIFINGQYVNEATCPRAAVERVGMFIGGQLAAEFEEFSVRVVR